MTAEIRDAILERLMEACRELFDGYGLGGRYLDRPPGCDFELAGSIGFSGRAVRGNLTLFVTRHVLEDMRSRGYHCEEDWVGELANQLLGRLKLKLYRAGIDVVLSTPKTISGRDLRPLLQDRESELWFQTVTGVAGVHLATEFHDDVSLDPCRSDGESLTEGETVFF